MRCILYMLLFICFVNTMKSITEITEIENTFLEFDVYRNQNYFYGVHGMKKQNRYQMILLVFLVLICGLWYSRWFDRHRLQLYHKEEETAFSHSQELPKEAAVPEQSLAHTQENIEQTAPEPFCININTATKEELMLLDGVGETLAERIIAYRTQHGLFTKLEQIKNVKGIGEKTYMNLVAYITIES